MKKIILSLLGLVLMFGLIGTVVAIGSTIVLADPSAVGANAIATTAEQFIGAGSWANILDGNKFSLWISPELYFGQTIAISDILEIEYFTNKPVTGSSIPNFYVNIYTKPDGINDDASWYGYRLTGEPLYSNNLNEPANVWNEWTTDSGTNQLTFFNAPRTVFGFYGGPTLTDIQAGPIDWGAYPTSGSAEIVDYSGEVVKYFVLDTGSGWDATFNGYLDAITIRTTKGDFTIDLEVPKSEVLTDSGVSGKGVGTAPGLQKAFNPDSKAAEHAGKKK